MHLIQILIPLYDNQKEPFPSEYYSEIRIMLTSKFGGGTAHSNSPATGLWKENDEKIVKDKIIIYEVMADDLDRMWWAFFKGHMEKLFQQDEIVIRASRIELM
ncbi:hypothetical protein [Arcticibacter tournemirensis]